jgi:hypothetical protein
MEKQYLKSNKEKQILKIQKRFVKHLFGKYGVPAFADTQFAQITNPNTVNKFEVAYGC